MSAGDPERDELCERSPQTAQRVDQVLSGGGFSVECRYRALFSGPCAQVDINCLTAVTQSCSQGLRAGGLTCSRRPEEFHDHWNLPLPLKINPAPKEFPVCPPRDANDVLKRVGPVNGKAAAPSPMVTAKFSRLVFSCPPRVAAGADRLPSSGQSVRRNETLRSVIRVRAIGRLFRSRV